MTLPHAGREKEKEERSETEWKAEIESSKINFLNSIQHIFRRK